MSSELMLGNRAFGEQEQAPGDQQGDNEQGKEDHLLLLKQVHLVR